MNEKLQHTGWLWLLSLVAFAEMAWLSTAKYLGYNLQSFDLGNMSQAIWNATQGEPLTYTTDGLPWSRLAWHVEVFYFLLAPLYMVWPSPNLLLIFQAALYVTGSLPLYRMANRQVQSQGTALALTMCYLFYPVAQTAVLFQFHSDTLAMPILLWALYALDRGETRVYTFCIFLALTCKFYVAVPVAALGFILFLQRRRRIGLGTMLLAALWGAIAFLIVRPVFTPDLPAGASVNNTDYLGYYFSQLALVGADWIPRLLNGLFVLGPTALLIWRAPLWLVPAFAVIVPSLLSTGPGPAYDYRYHHYALAVPFLMAGLVYGAAAMRTDAQMRGEVQPWRNRVWLTLGLVVIFNALLVDTPLNPRFYSANHGSGLGLSSTGYRPTARDQLREEWLNQVVPEGVPVIADDLLGSRLTNRPLLYRTHPQFMALSELLSDVDYVAVDALYDYAVGDETKVFDGGVTTEHGTIRLLLRQDSLTLTEARDGLLLFDRQGDALLQTVSITRSAIAPPPVASFGDLIGMENAEVRSLGNLRFLLRVDWILLQPVGTKPPLMAVSRIDTVDHSRIVHLPTLALLPTTEWQAGHTIQESIEFVVPTDIPEGDYGLFVGWYDPTSVFASETDSRSRIGDEVQLATLTLP